MRIIQYLPYSYHIHNGGVEKIAQTLSDNAKGEVHIYNIASDIAQSHKGHLTDTYSDTYFIPAFEIIPNYPVPKFWHKKWRQHINYIKNYKPDVVITHTRFFLQSMIGGAIAKYLGCKRAHIEHGSGFVTGYPRYIKICARLFDWTIGLWIFRQCDMIVTISQSHKDFIAKFTKKQPIVIYNPVDYIPQPKIKNTIPHIGFVGRLVPLKGVDLLLQSLANIRYKQRTCTIVGTGSEEKKLQKLAKDLGISTRVTFIGADERANRLHRFDIFINPSYQEGVPITVIEALIAKCIVVATDVGGTQEISLQDDLILIKSGNIEALSHGLIRAFDHLDRAGKSCKHVIDKFETNKVIKKYIDILY